MSRPRVFLTYMTLAETRKLFNYRGGQATLFWLVRKAVTFEFAFLICIFLILSTLRVRFLMFLATERPLHFPILLSTNDSFSIFAPDDGQTSAIEQEKHIAQLELQPTLEFAHSSHQPVDLPSLPPQVGHCIPTIPLFLSLTGRLDQCAIFASCALYDVLRAPVCSLWIVRVSTPDYDALVGPAR